MGVAAEDGGHVVFLTETQKLEVVVACLSLLALGRKGMVVDLEQGVRLLGCKDKGFEVEFGGAVARVTDDVNLGVAYDIEHPLGVLSLGAALIAFLMDAGNGDVETVEVFVIEVETSLRVEDVDLAAHEDADAVHLTGNDEHVAEIDDGACALDAGAVFGDAQYLQSLVGCCLRHFLQAAVCVS